MLSIVKWQRHHPSFVLSDDIQLLCRPLKGLGVEYFSHVRRLPNGLIHCFAQNSRFLSHYLSHQYYNYDAHCLPVKQKEQFMIWDLYERSGMSKVMHEDFMGHGFGHTFSIIQHHGSHTDYYHFASKANHCSINSQYLNLIPNFKQFIGLFQYKIQSHKSLQQIYDPCWTINCQKGHHQLATSLALPDEGIANIEAKKLYVPSKNQFISAREYQCLHWLAQGKTQDETAIILSLTERTVRAHLNNIKSKMGLSNLFQLGIIYSEIRSLNDKVDLLNGYRATC